MNDQELLTYAAKAVGISLEWEYDPAIWQPMYYEGKTYHSFDPLTSDADAFQLMVKLHMCVRHISWLSSDAWKIQVGVCMDFLTEQKCGDDPLQAARRAIVEMAAEIGKGM